MTTIQPDPQGTGTALTRPITLAIQAVLDVRHRAETTTIPTPPVWFLLALTGLAFLTGVAAWMVHSLALMLLAGGYAGAAFAADVYAAIASRKAGA